MFVAALLPRIAEALAMRSLLRDYLTSSDREKRGSLWLAILFVVLLAGGYLIPLFVKPDKGNQTDMAELSERVNELWADPDSSNLDQSPVELDYFDPNTIDEEGWRALGIEDRVARNIMSYQEHGGKFYRKEDLLRIYSMTKEDYLRLERYIRIGGSQQWRSYDWDNDRPSYATSYDPAFRLEVNSADSATWTVLRGIGPVLSARIVKYRDARGGFRSVDDLQKVYGLSGETYQLILPHVYIDSLRLPVEATADLEPEEPTTTVQLLELNTADSATLDALPGIGSWSARNIIRYRSALGGFHSVAQLLEVSGAKNEFYEMHKDKVFADPTRIRKLDLNKTPHRQLLSHPYITKALADFIVSYRMRNAFTSIDDLRRSYLVDEELLEQLRWYLVVSY